MHDFIIVYIYTTKDLITQTNLDSIKKNNPGVPIFDICSKDFTEPISFLDSKPPSQWKSQDLWYWGCDSLFMFWYLISNIRAKNYLIIEWDTYCNNISIKDFIGEDIIANNSGITAAKVIDKQNYPSDIWFVQQKNNDLLNNLYTITNTIKCSPLCLTLINDKCINDIIQHIKLYPEANKLYVETKFGTIAKYLGYEVKEYPQKLSEQISYHENICENFIKKSSSLDGLFHPIKKLSIYRKYFQSNQNIINNNLGIKIHSAIYGAATDITQDLNILLNHQQKLIKIDNKIAGDPAPYKFKKLYLKYEKNGQLYEKVINEGENLELESL